MLLMPSTMLLFLVMGKKRITKIAVFILILPMVIETVQNFIPGRDPDIRDFFANSLGGLLVLFLSISNQKQVRA